MHKLAKLLGYKINQMTSHSIQEGPEKSTQQRALTAQEVTAAFVNADKGPPPDMKHVESST